MEAIDFGFDFIHESRKGRKSMMSWIKGIPLCTTMQDDEYFFEVEFFDEELGDYKYARYGFSFRWHRDDESGEIITDEWIEARENTSVRYNSFLKRNEGKYRKGKETVAYRKIELDELQLAIDVLALLDDIDISGVVKDIHDITFRVQKNKVKNVIANARDLGLSVGEYLFELLSGDSDSYKILESYMEVN